MPPTSLTTLGMALRAVLLLFTLVIVVNVLPRSARSGDSGKSSLEPESSFRRKSFRGFPKWKSEHDQHRAGADLAWSGWHRMPQQKKTKKKHINNKNTTKGEDRKGAQSTSRSQRDDEGITRTRWYPQERLLKRPQSYMKNTTNKINHK